MLAALLATLVMQAGTIGPALPGDPTTVPTLPPQPPRSAPAASPAAPAPAAAALSSRLERCLSVVTTDPVQALSAGDTWLRQAKGLERAEAGHCRGMALIQLGRQREAVEAFVAAQTAVAKEDAPYAARLGALAGNAALLGNDGARALPLLDAARAGALAAGEQELALSVQLDAVAARASLGQVAEAEQSLAAARQTHPQNAEIWLMSAALARQSGDLAAAQKHIEQAATLAPREPQVALEAGVIAALAGRNEAAAQSWRSVLALAPTSPAAAAARDYLTQIGAAAAPTSAEAPSR
jgi:tetratricopeptide (TPR) repeat protein